MQKFSLFFSLLFLPLALLATDCIPDSTQATDWTLEVGGASYHPSSKSFSKIYTQHLWDYQVQASKRVHPFCDIWASVDWSSKCGHAHRTFKKFDHTLKERSRLFLVPISLGARWIYPILPFVDLYAGAGICYSFLRIKNVCEHHYAYSQLPRPRFKTAIQKNAPGALLQLGFQVATGPSTFLDFFVDYYSQRFHFSHHRGRANRSPFKHDLDCSGLKWGAGFGVYF